MTPIHATRSTDRYLSDSKKTETEEAPPFCPICYDHLLDDRIQTVCNHVFHKNCLYRWLVSGDNCPMCRTYLPIKQISGGKESIRNRIEYIAYLVGYHFKKVLVPIASAFVAGATAVAMSRYNYEEFTPSSGTTLLLAVGHNLTSLTRDLEYPLLTNLAARAAPYLQSPWLRD